ncbi:MAG: four helix bundle protein [candidate division KSB1 bacterium]|nr:four helix bundle protein [candidate division KSB1 bacterium]
MPDYFRFAFEKLNVWQEARVLSKNVYFDTKDFPGEEKFGIINQMRRAAVSVCSNIAEGSSRTSAKDQAHFYQLSYSSLMELMNQVIIANDLGYLNNEKENQYRLDIEKVANMLNSLRKSRLNK